MKRSEFLKRVDEMLSGKGRYCDKYGISNNFFSCQIIDNFLGHDAYDYYNELMGNCFLFRLRDFYCEISEFDKLDRYLAILFFIQSVTSSKEYLKWK